MSKYFKYAKEIISKNSSLFIITTIIIAITIILTTTALYSSIIANKFSNYLKNSPKISVLFDANTPVTEIQDFINKYKNSPAVQKIYQKKPEEVIKEYTPSNYADENEQLVKIVRIDLNPQVNPDTLVKNIYKDQATNENIIEIIYLPQLYKKLKVVSDWTNIVSICILLTFTIISTVLIYLTLRLGMEKLESEIKIMKNIGAPYSFIQAPLLLTTSLMIIAGGILGTLLTISVYHISIYTLKASELFNMVYSLLSSLGSIALFKEYVIISIMAIETGLLLIAGIVFTKIITHKLMNR